MAIAFRGSRFFLSNYSPCPNGVTLFNIRYPTSEHAYQAQKVPDRRIWAIFANLATPGDARALGQVVKLTDVWEANKVDTMYRVVMAKFTQNHDLREQLLETGEEHLVETNTWGDKFWGECPAGTGENWLGRILMRVRQELRAAAPPPPLVQQ